MNRLEGNVALITGAARGMGESHARRFIAEGAKVVMTDRSEAQGRALAAELGERAIFLTHDVTDAAQWETVVAKAERAVGPINILVNNAGILGPVAQTAELKEADYLQVCAVNQHSVFLGMRAVLPSMVRSGGGSIVNISSIAGMAANYGFPSLAYVASKFAVRGMTKAAAIEYGRHNIRVNSVHPGFIQTPMMVEATNEDHASGLVGAHLELVFAGQSLFGAVRYEDDYVRDTTGWRISRRDMRTIHISPWAEFGEAFASRLPVRWPGVSALPSDYPRER